MHAGALRTRHFVLVCIGSIIELACLYRIQQPQLQKLVDVTIQLSFGHPPWRAFQNRILAPLAIRLAADITGISYTAAWEIAVAALTVTMNLLAYSILSRLFPTRDAFLRMAAFLVLFFFCQLGWTYPWDYCDAIISLLLTRCAAERSALPVVAALFGVAVLNRDSAIFIGLWTIFDGILAPGRWGILPFRPELRSRWRLFAGLAMVVATPVISEFLRSRLYVASTYVEGVPPWVWPEYGPSYHFRLFFNFRMLQEIVQFPTSVVPLEALTFFTLVTVLLVYRLRSGDLETQKLALAALAQALLIPIFAIMAEFRVYDSLLPFLVLLFGTAPRWRHADGPAAGESYDGQNRASGPC